MCHAVLNCKSYAVDNCLCDIKILNLEFRQSANPISFGKLDSDREDFLKLAQQNVKYETVDFVLIIF